jgi:hypothetical protein
VQGVVARHRQHVMESLLRELRIGGVGRVVKSCEQGQQTELRVFEFRRLSLEVGKDLQLRCSGACLESADSPASARQVVGRCRADQVVGVFDSLAVGRRRRRIGCSDDWGREGEGQAQRRRCKSAPQDAGAQVVLATPGRGGGDASPCAS